MNANWLPIASFVISLLAIPTLMGLIWKDVWERKKENSEKRKAEKKKELQENVREVIKEENKPIKESIEEIDKKLDLVSDGTLCSLRNDIKNCYYECLEKGYRNDYDFQNIHDLYEAYENLGGNSFITDIMVRFDRLPPKDEFKKIQAEKEKIKEVNNKILTIPNQQIRVQKVPAAGKQVKHAKGGASNGE